MGFMTNAKEVLVTIRESELRERHACADLVANAKMADILHAMGEMTAAERRICKALQGFFAAKIRSRRQ